MMNSAEARRIDSKWSSDLRVLSVRQPWAWLIVQGYKDIENRTWSTTYRGRLLIHASSKKPSLDLLLQVKRDFKLNLPECFDLGGIVGFADVVDCVTSSRSRWMQGPIGWKLKNASPLPAHSANPHQSTCR
jgi:hypothetical protein